MMRQPISQYNDAATRRTVGFWAGAQRDLNAQILGTGAVIYDPSKLHLNQSDFAYPNMADLFVALAAMQRNLPRICVRRHPGWLQKGVATESSGIWAQSQRDIEDAKPAKAGMTVNVTALDAMPKNIALPSTFLARRMYPISRSKGHNIKAACVVLTYNNLVNLQQAVFTWQQTRHVRYDWTLVVVDGGSTDDTLHYLHGLFVDIQTEVFTMFESTHNRARMFNAALELLNTTTFDIAFVVSVFHSQT
jgi:hypothetical protein